MNPNLVSPAFLILALLAFIAAIATHKPKPKEPVKTHVMVCYVFARQSGRTGTNRQAITETNPIRDSASIKQIEELIKLECRDEDKYKTVIITNIIPMDKP